MLWNEDVAHATDAATQVATQARTRLERDGAPIEQLRRCEPDARDGTRLPGCMKIYLPPPAGQWGIVFQLAADERGPFLAVLAFGERHPGPARRPSIYKLADRRLHRTER